MTFLICGEGEVVFSFGFLWMTGIVVQLLEQGNMYQKAGDGCESFP